MSAPIDFAVASARNVLLIFGLLITLSLIVLIAFAVFLVVMGCYQYVQRHDLSKAYVAGGATGFLAYAIRNRLGPGAVVALIVGEIVAITATELAAAGSSSVSSGNPPPVVSPLQESQLEYPTDVPERIERQTAPWPPFTGVRVELGGDQH